MIWIGRIAAALVGLFSLGAGVMTILSPMEMGEGLGIERCRRSGSMRCGPISPPSFWQARCRRRGALCRQAALILGAAVLYGPALLGRILGIAVDGVPEGIVQPLVVEFTMVVLSVFAAKALARG